ncbi:MAG: hypothetical protein UFD80_00050 [Blautia sp.]|nr:hypothetical protein [Blautia sp.]
MDPVRAYFARRVPGFGQQNAKMPCGILPVKGCSCCFCVGGCSLYLTAQAGLRV